MITTRPPDQTRLPLGRLVRGIVPTLVDLTSPKVGTHLGTNSGTVVRSEGLVSRRERVASHERWHALYPLLRHLRRPTGAVLPAVVARDADGVPGALGVQVGA